MTPMQGYFDFYWNDEDGSVYLEIDRFGEDFLYVNSLAAGLGSNDIGLDRNQLGNSRVVRFKRVGNKVMLQQPNLDYRAVSDNPDEVNSVRDAFAASTLWGFKVAAKTGDRVLVNLTPMLLSDAHGVTARLKRNKQGSYKIDASRSAVYPEKMKNFPKNSEFEATVTFTGTATGGQLRSVTPTSGSFSLRMHHSFVELPDDNYKPRAFDPRSGYFYRSYQDYATPIDQSLTKRFITRHRLEKKDPSAAMSEPVEPIVYYLDRGAPEPIRSALIEGASWWNQAFEAAGFKNAFQVRVLPEDADPMDVRYNVINWVHRSTRGWSYGSSVTDPLRQDFLLAQGLIRAYADGENPDPELEKMALARLRQLSAHEVGHTIGLAHNFAASVNGRASVMDYPHPYVTLDGDKVDFSEAYDVGIGDWDKQTIKYGYSVFPAGTDESARLNNILEENAQKGLFYVSDSDRDHALNRMGEDNIPEGMPLSELEKVMVPVYLMHRYQVEAVGKMIGGYEYGYAVRGGSEKDKVRPVDMESQMEAIAGLLRTLEPAVLAVPENLRGLIPPPAQGYSRTRESFKTTNGGGFDPLAMAAAAADNSLAFLLHPQRAARIIEQNVLYPDEKLPGLNDYLLFLSEQLEENLASSKGYERELARVAHKRYVAHLLELAANTKANEQVQAEGLAELVRIKSSANGKTGNGAANGAHYLYVVRQIEQFLADPTTVKVRPAPSLPDGSPIGCGGMH